jgi:hypothetical protein
MQKWPLDASYTKMLVLFMPFPSNLQILDRDVAITAETMNAEAWDRGAGIRMVQRPAAAGQPGLG